MTAARIAIIGNTYPVREQLKTLGARWDADQKAWMVSAAEADEARAIVAAAPAKSSNNSSSYRPTKCRVCGAVPRRNSRGYTDIRILRSGECSDCYEERKMGY